MAHLLKTGGHLLKKSGHLMKSNGTGTPCSCCGGGGGVTCPTYCSGTTPAALTITFTGVVNAGCADCILYNSTSFVLTQIVGTPCSYYLSFSNSCGSGDLRLNLLATKYQLVVNNPGGGSYNFEWSRTSPYDCTASGNLAFVGGAPTINCNFTGATAHVA